MNHIRYCKLEITPTVWKEFWINWSWLLRNWKGHCGLHMSQTLEHNFMISMLSWTDSLQAKRSLHQIPILSSSKKNYDVPLNLYIGTLERMWTLERCWNIKALSPTVYWWNYNGVLYYNKIIDNAQLQVWYHWTHLDFNSICEEPFCRIERMVFCVDLKTSWVPRQRATHQLTEGLFPVHLSLLFPSKKALPSCSDSNKFSLALEKSLLPSLS